MLFSVITVVRNERRLIEPTVQSVLFQTCADYEYIVVDGDSDDGTVGVLERLLSDDGRIVSEPDDGIFDAMNKGIRLAKGEFLVFMNGGDRFASSSVLEQVAGHIRDDDSILYGRTAVVHDITEGKGARFVGRQFDRSDFVKGRMYCHQSEFIRRDLFQGLGPYNTDFEIAADFEFRLRAVRAGILPRHIDVDCTYYLTGGFSAVKGGVIWDQRAQAIAANFGLRHAARYETAKRVNRVLRRLRRNR